MKTKIYIIAFLNVLIQAITYAQGSTSAVQQSPTEPGISFWKAYADKIHLTTEEKKEFLSAHQKIISANQLYGVSVTSNQNKQYPYNPQPTSAGPCINIDYENGSLSGWAPSSGFHPGFNPLGCCPNPGGQQLITSGPGTDPAGGFPIVAPGGNFSLRLGDSNTGGEADRIEQTFMVSAANANFTYRYAVVLQDPGHTTSQQPAFTVEMLDSTGAQVPCTFYNVTAGGNIPGFFNSQSQANVVYKPWTNVLVDLTNYIGQNVTIRFSTYDCALGGHYGYAYIDGNCQAFVSGTADSVCAGVTKTFCAPNGLGSYTWNGPGMSNITSQCINATTAGIYTCQTTLVTGCAGPVFTYTLYNFPNPVASFSAVTSNACAVQYTFANNSTITNGVISSYNWNFGNNSSTQQNPVFSFPGTGNYPVSLQTISNKGCSSSTLQTVTIYPNPVISFNAPSTCMNSLVTFNNNSSVSNGSILTYTWSFGNGGTSQAVNPSVNYTAAGNFPVGLSGTSDKGCTSTVINNITIYPLPAVAFMANNACQGLNTNFTNISSIQAGNIANYVWDFDNNGTPDNNTANPAYVYPSAGTYTTNLVATSNFGCVNAYSAPVIVYANPTSLFTCNNVCAGLATSFVNQSSAVQGDQIQANTWSFGDGSYGSSANALHTYGAAGLYNVALTVTSIHNCISVFNGTTAVYNVPSTNFTSNNACQNQTTQFNNSTIIPGGTISKWRWDFQNDGIWDDSVNVNPAIVYPSFGTYNCKLQAVSDKQCSSQKINNVVVHANPVAGFYTKSSCLGDITTFTNTSYSADGAITSNQWDFNGDNIVDNIYPTPTYSYLVNGTYLVKLEVQTEFGCTDVKSKSIYVNPRPIPLFASKNNVGCPQLCVSFTNSSSIATGSIVTTQWLFGDGSLPSYSLSPTHCYNTGEYAVTLKVVSDSGCVGTLTQPNFVKVYDPAMAAFKVTPEEVDELEPNISVTSEASNAYATAYYINDGSSYGVPDFNHTLKDVEKNKPIIFQVVTTEHGCRDTTYKILDVKPTYVLYIPNTFTPNSDGLNDGFFAKGVGIAQFNLKIYDRWGHILFEANDINEKWDGTVRGSSEPIKQDVYVWKAEVRDIMNHNHSLTGHVSLIK